MNKKYNEFLSSIGLMVNGNSAYGFVQGYEINFKMNIMDNAFPVRIHFTCYTTDEQKRNILDSFRNATIKFSKFEFTEFGLYVSLNDITNNKILKRLGDLISTIIGILDSNGAVGTGICPVCGESINPENSRQYDVGYGMITVDNECIDKINVVIQQENKDFEQAPNNYLRGFLGALIGGIVGGVIAIVLYFVGFVASISSIVAVALGAFLYAKFGGKQNKMMIVIVSVTTLVIMVLSIFIVYLIAAGQAAAQEGLDMSAIEALKILMENREFSSSFLYDMLMVVGFSIIGIVVVAIDLARKIKRKKQINTH